MGRSRRGDGIPDPPLDLEWGSALERQRLFPVIIRDLTLPDNHPDRESVAWFYHIPNAGDRFDGVESPGLVVVEILHQVAMSAVDGFEDPTLVQRLVVVVRRP